MVDSSRKGAMNPFAGRFAGQTAVITGAGSGIGLAVAARLQAEGANVSAWDISQESLDAGNEFFTQQLCMDQSDENDVARATQSVIDKFGAIDVLVVSAGITGPNKPLIEYPFADWRKVMDINVNGVFYVNRAIVPHMLKCQYGRIVNIASVAGKEGNPNASAYSASKAGVIGFTKSLGKELAESGILVNAVTPAVFTSPFLAQMPQSQIEYMKGKIPMGRLGEISEVTALVCWLLSDECSFSTAATFDISGGRTTY